MTCEQRFQLACESKQEEVIHGRNTINDVKDLTADDVEDVTADVEDLVADDDVEDVVADDDVEDVVADDDVKDLTADDDVEDVVADDDVKDVVADDDVEDVVADDDVKDVVADDDVEDVVADDDVEDVEDLTVAADDEEEENAWRRPHDGGRFNGFGIQVRSNWNSIQRTHWMLTIHFPHSFPVTRQEEDFVMRVLNAYFLENTLWKRLVIGYERCPSTRRFHAHVYLATERTVRMTRSLRSISLRVIPNLREPLRPHINYLDGPDNIINVISEEYVDAIKSGKWRLPEYFLFQNGSRCRQFRDLLVGNQPMKSATHCRLVFIFGVPSSGKTSMARDFARICYPLVDGLHVEVKPISE